jgi:hypothetical protein
MTDRGGAAPATAAERAPSRGREDPPGVDLIAHLRAWRETRRPLECKGQKPCWVEAPYAAADEHSSECATCFGKLKFDGRAFEVWLREWTNG